MRIAGNIQPGLPRVETFAEPFRVYAQPTGLAAGMETCPAAVLARILLRTREGSSVQSVTQESELTRGWAN